MNIKTIFILLFLVPLTTCIFSNKAFSQQPGQIRLLDADNSLPIQGVAFQYGDESGISDQNGTINFRFPKKSKMKLSHINYGKWEWDNEEISEFIRQKVYYRESIVISLYPVTIIALRKSGKPDESITINYRDRMEHDGAAILNQMPAINSIRKSGNYGFDPVFRGFKYDRINVVLNGAQSATAACPNRMDPPTSQMAPNMIDKIEILKGPHALRYGTGIGATINFVPSRLRFTDKTELYGRFSSEYQTNGNVIRSEGQLGFSGNRYDFSLFSSWSQGDDYKSGDSEKVQADFNRGSFGANLGLRLPGKHQLRLSALYNLARDADFPALPMDLREDDTWLFNVRHDASFNNENLKNWNTVIYGSLVDHRMDNLLKPLDPRTINAETEAKTYNYGGRTEGIWHFSNARLYAGLDLRLEGARGEREREFLVGPNAGNTVMDNAWQHGQISKTGIFGEYHLNMENFQYVISGRLEINNSDSKDPVDEFTNVYPQTQTTQINPGFSLGIQKTFGDRLKTGLWLGRAQRSGSLTERFINYFPVGLDPYEMLGNPKLKPEINNQADLTFTWTSNISAIDIDIFASYMENYISSVINPDLSPRLPMSPGVRQYINIDKAFKTGFELSWTQKLIASLEHQAGIAYTYAQDLELDEPLPEVAPLEFVYVARGAYLNNRLQPEVSFRHAMEQSRISTEYGETTTPSFSLLDLKITFQMLGNIRFTGGVKNLLDENYYEHLSRSVRGTQTPIFAPGRSFFGSISVSF